MNRAPLIGVGVLLLSGAAGGAAVQELPAATTAHGGFALPDGRGARLLASPELTRPELVKTALCSGGRRVPFQFERRQIERAGTFRHSSRNFDALAGSVFTVAGPPVDADVPCFLAADAMLADSSVLGITAPEGTGGCTVQSRIATMRHRPVVRCWPIARLARGQQVVLVEFERREKDALASLVLVDGARLVFADFPAEYRGPSEDLWRVDDGGVLSPDGFAIVCVLQRGDGYVLGLAWAGAEGRSLSLWVAERGDRFTHVISDYWYQAPV
jgi:hypothetical protein